MIELRGVTKQYLYGKRVLGVTDLTVRDGEILAVLGGTGSGKTSLLKTIAGVADCEGEALIDGAPLSKRPDNLQFVFDDLAVFKNRTCFYNLAYPFKMRGVDKEKIRDAVYGVVAELDMRACLFEKVKKLPLIDVKRLAIARLLMRDARNILIDEITSGLSALEAKELWSQLVPILLGKAGKGVTVVYSTSSADEALSIADRIAVMSGGELKQLDTPSNIYESPASVWAAQALDEYYHFESAQATLDGDRLTLTFADGATADISCLKDRILPSYIGRKILAGWHGKDFASEGTRMEKATYVVRYGENFVHYTDSGARVVSPKRTDVVCTQPRADRVTLFDAENENSILI